jgi:XTP/dITP diphosphohydrolase
MRRLIIATRNRHKTGEIAAILGRDWIVEDLTKRPELPEPVEDGATFEENAAIKALAASRALHGLVLADDSGLEVDLLDGAPGIRSARYAGEKATDKENRDKLLTELAEIHRVAEHPMTARFRCAMVIAKAGEVLGTFSGAVEGRIVMVEAGTGGFGYDPLFVPEGFEQTFAEMDAVTKNRLSHRARALEQAVAWLNSAIL